MAPQQIDLSGKVACVTGGSRGMGKEMVKAFAEAGADVVIASRKFDACAMLAREVTESTGQRALPIETHVGYWEQCNALVEATYAEFGKCDILVNNAGMSPLYESVASISESLYDKVLDVNLKGPFRLMAAFGERMAATTQGGSIINVSSVAAVRPTPNEATYGAAKAGLNALTLSLAREYGPRVRVNCIMPGPFLTDIAKAWDLEEFNARAQQDIALQRGGQPNEIVGAALYFASDVSSYTTGSILKIDGGTVYPPG